MHVNSRAACVMLAGSLLLTAACATREGVTTTAPVVRPTTTTTTTGPSTKPPTTPPRSIPPLATPSPLCPDSPKLGIYNPDNFLVLEGCVWYRGVVASVKRQTDLDWQLNVKPDPGYEDLLNESNDSKTGGALVIQIMPGQRLRIPDRGEHISVFGTHVQNIANGWNEIHPVFTVDYTDTGVRVEAIPPREPVFTPSP